MSLLTYRALLVHRSGAPLVAGAGAVLAAVRVEADLRVLVLVASLWAVFRSWVHLRDATASAQHALPPPDEPVRSTGRLRITRADVALILLSAALVTALAQWGGDGAGMLTALLAGMLMGETLSLLAVVTWVTAWERSEQVVLVCRDPEPEERLFVRGLEVTPLYRIDDGALP
jgi:hypothetical protein